MSIATSNEILKRLPSVMAFRRGVIVSDAPMEYETADGQTKPVMVKLHGAVGTQNVNEKTQEDGTTTVAGSERNVANPQYLESAKLGPDAVRMLVSFDMKTLSLTDAMHSCASASVASKAQALLMRDSLVNFIARAQTSEGLNEVARRVARNICNGRWLWRNRVMASSIEITVIGAEKTWVIPNALALSLQNFDNPSQAEIEIGAVLAAGMAGTNPRAYLRMEARVDFGVQGAIEVYGSQLYEPREKNKDPKAPQPPSRTLYKLSHPDINPALNITGQAALRDAKVWNALRTFDTWYPDYAIQGMPLPVEPQGASLAMMDFFRSGDSSAFSMFKRLNVVDPSSPEGMFCIASLMRGGVFSEGEDAEKPAKKGKAAKAAETPAVAEE